MTATGILPVTAPRRPQRAAYGTHAKKFTGSRDLRLDFLTERARTTNLAVIILAGIAAVSILINIRVWIGNEVFTKPGTHTLLPVPLSIRATLPAPRRNLRHLVLLPGHAIWTGSDATIAAESDKDWILEDFQKGGEVRTFVEQVTRASEIAARDPEALLIFSGGQTRNHADLTEGTSYARLANAGNIYSQFLPSDRRSQGQSRDHEEYSRVTTEEYALDSLQNLMFSIARFKEYTGHYPTFITVVGFELKRRRFVDLHRHALQWPESAFRYVGIDSEQSSSIQAMTSEKKNTYEAFARDLWGCRGALLAKRRHRNPYRRFNPYHSSVPELDALFEYCPREKDDQRFKGKLPWA